MTGKKPKYNQKQEFDQAFSEALAAADPGIPANPKSSYGNPTKLVRAEQLLIMLFEEDSRPSLRWLRGVTMAREIPSIKLGRLRFYDPEQVRTALAEQGRRFMAKSRRIRTVEW